MDIYYNSIGRNATLLLNFPVMPDGRIHPYDEKAVLTLAKEIKKAFAANLANGARAAASNFRGKAQIFGADKAIDKHKESYWATDDSVRNASLTLNFSKPIPFNRFLVQEYIRLGQRVKSFTVDAWVNNEWTPIAKETTIGYKRIVRFPTVVASKLRLTITDAKSCPLISNIEVYNAPILLAAPSVMREKSGDVRIMPADPESRVYYSLDGTIPTIKSNKYTVPINTGEGKLAIKCIAYDPHTKKYSPIKEEKFDISRKPWKIAGIMDEQCNNILDGNPGTQWYQDKTKKSPVDLVIDLGKMETVSGFKYLPDQNWWASGIITNYSFYISEDGNVWNQVDTGEFSNIKNNPIMQTKLFQPAKARYIKLRATKNTQGDDTVGYAEVDVITN